MNEYEKSPGAASTKHHSGAAFEALARIRTSKLIFQGVAYMQGGARIGWWDSGECPVTGTFSDLANKSAATRIVTLVLLKTAGK